MRAKRAGERGSPALLCAVAALAIESAVSQFDPIPLTHLEESSGHVVVQQVQMAVDQRGNGGSQVRAAGHPLKVGPV